MRRTIVSPSAASPARTNAALARKSHAVTFAPCKRDTFHRGPISRVIDLGTEASQLFDMPEAFGEDAIADRAAA